MIWKLPYHNLFIIHFSFWQVWLFDIVCSVKCKTAECFECGNMGFLLVQKSRITYVTWWYGTMWPIITPFALHKCDMFLKAIFSSKCIISFLISSLKHICVFSLPYCLCLLMNIHNMFLWRGRYDLPYSILFNHTVRLGFSKLLGKPFSTICTLQGHTFKV